LPRRPRNSTRQSATNSMVRNDEWKKAALAMAAMFEKLEGRKFDLGDGNAKVLSDFTLDEANDEIEAESKGLIGFRKKLAKIIGG